MRPSSTIRARLSYREETPTASSREMATGGGRVVTVTTGPDTHIINSGTNPGDPTPTLNMTPGITAESGSLAAAGGKITANVASTIDMFGKATADASFLN